MTVGPRTYEIGTPRMQNIGASRTYGIEAARTCGYGALRATKTGMLCMYGSNTLRTYTTGTSRTYDHGILRTYECVLLSTDYIDVSRTSGFESGGSNMTILQHARTARMNIISRIIKNQVLHQRMYKTDTLHCVHN